MTNAMGTRHTFFRAPAVKVRFQLRYMRPVTGARFSPTAARLFRRLCQRLEGANT